jgi:hypothetical protein
MKSTLSSDAVRLLRKLPSIRRTRFWHLYAYSGKRYLDFWAEGGRGVMGFRSSGIGRVAKAFIDTGLVSVLPGIWEYRLKKAVLKWHPEYKDALFFSSELRAIEECGKLSLDHMAPEYHKDNMVFELPFGEFLLGTSNSAEYPKDDTAIPSFSVAILPCHSAFSFGIVLVKDNSTAGSIESDIVAPIFLATACRALSNLDTFVSWYNEKHWSKIDTYIEGIFKRNGPWLYPLHSADRHEAFFEACLEGGILVSPEYNQPSLVPGEFDKGELEFFVSQPFRAKFQSESEQNCVCSSFDSRQPTGELS